MKNKKRFYRLIALLFIVFNLVFVVGRFKLEEWGFNLPVLLAGNLFLCLVTLATFWLHDKAMLAKDTQTYLRNVYLAMFGKLMLCAIAAMIYIFVMKKALNKPSLFFCMFLYLLYTFVEISSLMRLNQERKNAG
jgi:FtsH-binding integral membrane protein